MELAWRLLVISIGCYLVVGCFYGGISKGSDPFWKKLFLWPVYLALRISNGD